MPRNLQRRDKRSVKLERSTQENFIGESKEGVAFAIGGYLLVFKLVVQMATPLRDLSKVVCRFQKH